MTYSVMYRGYLTSCNYSCGYCPFAKRVETSARLESDRKSVQNFTEWLAVQAEDQWRILFTPWGEALVRPWYREAMIRLSHLPHVVSVTAQTNLSCNLDWVARCESATVGFWATFHPTEVDMATFITKVKRLRDEGVRLSVGMVAIPDAVDRAEAVRDALPSDVYLWLNAQQPRSRPYEQNEITRFTAVDPQFPFTLKRTRSRGKSCRTGETSFTVDGAGDMRRCHFVDDEIGNIYSPNWHTILQPRSCPNQFCDCFLGKSQLQAEELSPLFGDHLLERVVSN